MSSQPLRVLVPVSLSLMLVGCAVRTTGPPVQEMDGEFRAVVTAQLGESDQLFVLEARRLYRAVLEGEAWSLQELWRPLLGTEWFGMSAGDVDRDGHEELVLWGFRPQLISVVLGQEGDRIVVEAGPSPLLLRAVPALDGDVLYGQRPGSEAAFAGPVGRYDLVEGKPARTGEMEPWAAFDVLEFFHGPSADGISLYAWDRTGILERWEDGAVAWRSEGLRMSRPLGRERERVNLLGERRTELDTFPTLPCLVDIDGDGVPSVVLAISDPGAVQVFERVRTFRGGTIRILDVGDRGLVQQARSVILGRIVTGVAAADVDGDGTVELVAAVVLRRRSGVGRGRSTLAAFSAGDADLLPLGRPAVETPPESPPGD